MASLTQTSLLSTNIAFAIMNKLSPLVKGIITAAFMLGLTLYIFYSKQSPSSGLSYVIYILYAAGITWTLIGYRNAANYTGKFGSLFGQGFRCFIIVTLIMVAFTGFFSAAHPEFAVEDAKNYKEYLDKEEKNKTPAEKDEMVKNLKNNYTTGLVWSATFGYLILGSIITAAGAGIILIRRK